MHQKSLYSFEGGFHLRNLPLWFWWIFKEPDFYHHKVSTELNVKIKPTDETGFQYIKSKIIIIFKTSYFKFGVLQEL